MLLSAASTGDSIGQFITVLILFVGVLALTALTTKWIAGYQKTQMSNRNMEMIETMRIGNNKYIQILRIGKKYIAVAHGKDTITMLSEIPKEDLSLEDDMSKGLSQNQFKAFFENAKKRSSEMNQVKKDEE